MKIKVLVLASALLLCGSAFAQENNKDANGNIQYGPYSTNKFWDNWFVSLSGGIDYTVENKTGGGLTPALDINVGKWIDPCFGVRAGWEGWKVAAKNANPDKYNYNQIHADFLWNISNQFWGYKEDRVYNCIPYFHASAILNVLTSSKKLGADIGAGFGLLNNIRLNDKLSIPIDVRGTILHGDNLGPGGAGLGGVLSVTAGLAYNFGVSNWKRTSSILAPALAAAAAAEAAKQAMQAEKDKANAQQAAAQNAADQLAKENDNLKKEVAQGLNDNSDLIKGLLETPMVVYFEIGKAKLSNKEQAHFDYIVKNIMSRGKSAKFTLSGNADSKTGSKRRNQQLSEQRADYIYKLLTDKYGMDADKFTVKANGGNDIFDTPELNRAVIIEAE